MKSKKIKWKQLVEQGGLVVNKAIRKLFYKESFG